MSPRRRLRAGKAITWYLAGFFGVLVGLPLGLDWLWPALRDPDFQELHQIIRDRQAEQPGRPLVLALGSSRMQMALWADRLNSPGDQAGPLVINGATAGAGPILQQVVLRRLLDAGVRPRLVLLEIMPMSLSARNGSPIEERQKFGERFSLAELVRVWPCYAQPVRMASIWFMSRALPWLRRQGDIREALGIHLPTGPTKYQTGRERDGWVPCPRPFSPDEVVRLHRISLEHYAAALTQPVLAAGAVKALRDGLTLCRQRSIPVVLVVPPESLTFRSHAPAVADLQMNVIRGLARELDVSLIDARAWVEDANFYDGHHVTRKGAEQFTERLGEEVIAPHFQPSLDRQAWKRDPLPPHSAPMQYR